jgi:DNA helicase II / ATP-dependent DNA helicase PcrA
MAWNDGLTAGTPAHRIAGSIHRRIRVLAGPGTGKSFAMKRRVARILEDEGINPSQVLAVTFTRVAAEDIQRELLSLGVEGADRLRAKTLHSLAMSLLPYHTTTRAIATARRHTNIAILISDV